MSRKDRQQKLVELDLWLQWLYREHPVLWNLLALGIAALFLALTFLLAGFL
jgi:hypothetical protein